MPYSTPEQLAIYNSDPFAKSEAKKAASKTGLSPQGGFSMDDWYASFVQAPSAGSSTSTAGTLTGQRTNRGSEATGYVPLVPDPLATANEAIAGATSTMPSIETLVGGINKFNQGQLLDQITSLNPSFTGSVAQAGSNIYDQLRGLIPQDVKNNQAQYNRERGVSSGMGSYSPNVDSALMRVYGLTSIGQQQAGLNNLGTLTGIIPKTTPADPTKWMVTPEQLQQYKTYASILSSSADPLAAYNLALANANRGLSAGYGAGSMGGGGGGSGSNTSWLDNLIGKYSTSQTSKANEQTTTTSSGSDFELNPEYFDPSGMPWFSGGGNGVVNKPVEYTPDELITLLGGSGATDTNTNFDPFNNWDYNDLGLQYNNF